ncbi:site-specific DNA-methyltransferase [Streptococcus suis]|uniref:site-specific DNA-methyltransferase n=1 Tax=Streptococcus suis TaxID=1307 RepID=UPI000428C6FF|nr:site-specific DNA-methyltransferase [Streptococcus suis]
MSTAQHSTAQHSTAQHSTAQQKLGEYTQVEKLDLSSKDILSDKIAKIGQLFPEVLTESSDENGRLRPAIDFDKLRQFLSREIVEGRESYEFTWVGKRGAIAEAGKPTSQTLRPDLEESVDFDKSENVFITGDNLEVLKVLQESYLGKIDMIYIDPPYNTGQDFVYRDRSQLSRKELEELSKQRNENDELLFKFEKNAKQSAKYHSDWLNMMYPRLVLARNLLKDSGVIFISIDDNEQANLKAICDEIFGAGNFVGNFVWEKTQHFGRQKINSYNNADYLLAYMKNSIDEGRLREVLVEFEKEEFEDAPLYNASNNLNVLEFPEGSVQFNIPDGEYFQSTDEKYSLLTPVTVKNSKNLNNFRLQFRSRWSNDTIQKEISKGTTFWVKTDKFAIRAIYAEGKKALESPRQIILTNNTNKSQTVSRFGKKVGTSEVATSYTNNLLSGDYFSYPKPKSLIEYIVSLYYCGTEHPKDMYILDFFAGSATTADAVMQLNAEDGGNRKYILCTLDEQVADKSAAKEAGFETIDQISRERIRRAAKKIQEEHPETVGKQDFGFRAYKLDSSNFKEVSQTPDSFSQESLFDSVSNIKDGRTDLDLLFQIMLTWGMELSLPIVKIQIDGTAVYNVDDGALLACFADEISESVIRQIAKEEPLRAVFKDESFANSAAKINLGQIFKEVAPNTKVKVV